MSPSYYQILLFLPVSLLSCLILSALRFDQLRNILFLTLMNGLQILLGSTVLVSLIYYFTPA